MGFNDRGTLLPALQSALPSSTRCQSNAVSAPKSIVCFADPFPALQYYDVTGQGTNDYPVTDLLQMMGRASRPLTDEQGM